MIYTASLENRFWAKVPIGPIQDCWIWSGNTNGRYPVLHVNGSSCVATRLMREFVDGKPVPQDMHVCHACDNPPCVNPAHLWIGTPSVPGHFGRRATRPRVEPRVPPRLQQSRVSLTRHLCEPRFRKTPNDQAIPRRTRRSRRAA
jgi:hypothetical protein